MREEIKATYKLFRQSMNYLNNKRTVENSARRGEIMKKGYFSVLGGGNRRTEYEQVTAETNEFLVNCYEDDDLVKAIQEETGRNIRDQLTPEEIKALKKEAELMRMGNRRN